MYGIVGRPICLGKLATLVLGLMKDQPMYIVIKLDALIINIKGYLRILLVMMQMIISLPPQQNSYTLTSFLR